MSQTPLVSRGQRVVLSHSSGGDGVGGVRPELVRAALQRHSISLLKVTSSNPEQIAFNEKALQSNDCKVAFRY